MLGQTDTSWRSARRSAATERILEAAWELSREHGLAGLSLRDLARTLGMAAPSLYSYFDSKHALYDALYAQGWQEFRDFAPQPVGSDADLATALRTGAQRWVRFSMADTTRYQLLNERTIPGFEPSPSSYAIAQLAYDESFAPVAAVHPLSQQDRDLISGLIAGLIAQQIANEPGGSRWVGQVDTAVDLLVHHLTRPQPKGKKR